MSDKKWKIEIPDSLQEQIDQMTPEEVQEIKKAFDELAQNPYRGTPLCPGFLGWRWIWGKIQFIWHEIKRLV